MRETAVRLSASMTGDVSASLELIRTPASSPSRSEAFVTPARAGVWLLLPRLLPDLDRGGSQLVKAAPGRTG